MLFHLLYPLHTAYSFFNVFRYITFRAIYAAITALVSHDVEGAEYAVLPDLLAAAFFGLGRQVQCFASYGGARRGTPVSSYIRVDDKPVRVRCDIERAEEVIAGVAPYVVLLVLGLAAGLIVLFNPAAERIFGRGEFLRPNFITLVRCENILIEGVRIRRSPMWEVHPLLSRNITVRGLDISDVSLIVFDEAHRAVGDYSYVAIAGEYLGKARHPMTLGLTASPSSDT